ncbi:homocysteine S-methyltransferase family protein [Paracoccus sp. 1_MG-2023]|uniref:homocysteine S-methyltransferase family protein n=1 Tax=unclassified Paracoccus (in: a-proteobacteria) TaxID=2688777 RepID=UPI001C0885C3|nr:MULTISPECIES: homocysteine S-methyltransferase family protein [unclassified Paracoccus (in: a-proteobacteria)]MBU2957762.1 homocysteine S-methyltransferase family protein [Paracoccus sp. C2R09]MDO6667390.1 homocysteine S-methyltransferase family protein [Paracoccus sp. 1_MG-2023]
MTRITLLDGGMSRELQRQGATLRQPEWSALALMNEPDTVRAAHAAFIAAGARVIIANSYAVVPFHLGDARFRDQGAALADLAGRLAREAADERPGVRVAGALPPACGSYIPHKFDPEAASGILAVLVRGMEPHVDLWIAETMSSIEEATVTAAAVRGSARPLWISYTLRDDARARQSDMPVLRSGERVADAVRAAIDAGAEAVLFNCSQPEVMEAATRIAAEVIGDRAIPVGVYANAFDDRHDEDGANAVLAGTRADLDPEGYGLWAERWIDAGATLIGGCCGINAPHIKRLDDHLRQRHDLDGD